MYINAFPLKVLFFSILCNFSNLCFLSFYHFFLVMICRNRDLHMTFSKVLIIFRILFLDSLFMSQSCIVLLISCLYWPQLFYIYTLNINPGYFLEIVHLTPEPQKPELKNPCYSQIMIFREHAIKQLSLPGKTVFFPHSSSSCSLHCGCLAGKRKMLRYGL